jgi:CubicO group peptidase (beta-lactamase class C family)
MKLKNITPLLLFIPILGIAQNLYFPPTSGNNWDSISPQSLNWCQSKIDSLYSFLETNNTKAFILLKDGKIVLEKYFGTHTQSSAWYWASAGKTLTSFLIGIAQQEKYLSISDTTSKFLGKDWTNCTPEQEDKITIRNQLTMTSGLDDGVADHYCTLDTCLVYKADAGTRWAYHNGPYTLLDGVIENATGSTLNNYATQKLKNPTGMTGTFITVDYNHVFYSTARSMARFGLLLLNKGNWNGNQILTDTAYFRQMTNSSQNLNLSYGYLTWLNGKSTYMIPQLQFVFNGFLFPNAPADLYAAMGKNGQFINVLPSKNMVWVRMGDAPDNSDVPFLLNDQVWQHLNVLECSPLRVIETRNNTEVNIFPNPADCKLSVISGKEVYKLEFYNCFGKLVKILKTNGKEFSISIDNLNKGMYFVRLFFADGQIITRKIFIESTEV